MKPQMRIFISSTWEDLQPERNALEKLLRRLDRPSFVGMEFFGSRPEISKEVCMKEVDDSDIYLGIIGFRYGTIDHETGKSFTELEYRRAMHNRIPCLIYIKSDEASISANQVEQDPANSTKLKAFKTILLREHTVSQFKGIEELMAGVLVDLNTQITKFQRRSSFPAEEQQYTELPSRQTARVPKSYKNKTEDAENRIVSVPIEKEDESSSPDPQTFSKNIWDYLVDIPYMPSRQDRDELVQQAARTPKQEKRVRIWEYFFHLRPQDIGKPQMKAIKRLKLQGDSENQIERLQKAIVALQRQIPEPSTVNQIYQWLEEDIAWLSQHAIDQTGLNRQRIFLGDDTPNPICFIGPAYLQRSKLIPELLLDPREVDRRMHLAAARLDFFSDKRFIDLYGIYYFESFIVTDEVLGNYGCFFDFITGRIYNEQTSELYYSDVVALTTRQQYRKVDLNFFQMVLENAPTFSLSLSSGDSIQVTYASSEYIKNWFRRLMLTPQAEFEFDPDHWLHNPEIAAEKAFKVLRNQLRKHKGTDVEGKVELE
jgi:hypothetical protein